MTWGNWADWLAVIGAIIGLSATAIEWRRNRTAIDDSQSTLDQRIARLGDTMSYASRTIGSIQAELQAQQAAARQLAAEVEQSQTLADLNREAADAVAEVIRSEVNKNNRKSFWVGLLVNFLFLLAGGAFTLAVTLWIQPLWACA